MIRPSFTSFLTFCLELALLISVVSFGSSQILRLPHFNTEAASLFCSRRVLKLNNKIKVIDIPKYSTPSNYINVLNLDTLNHIVIHGEHETTINYTSYQIKMLMDRSVIWLNIHELLLHLFQQKNFYKSRKYDISEAHPNACK